MAQNYNFGVISSKLSNTSSSYGIAATTGFSTPATSYFSTPNNTPYQTSASPITGFSGITGLKPAITGFSGITGLKPTITGFSGITGLKPAITGINAHAKDTILSLDTSSKGYAQTAQVVLDKLGDLLNSINTTGLLPEKNVYVINNVFGKIKDILKVNADPQAPVNADPQPPVNADPQPPVNADPQPQKTSALPLIKVTSITVNGEEYVAGKDYDYESEPPKLKITGTVESSETVKKVIVGDDYFGNQVLEAIVDENGNWSFEGDYMHSFHGGFYHRLIATTEESGITSGIKLEGISDYNGDSYFAHMLTHSSSSFQAGNLDDYLSGKSSYVVQTHLEPTFENVIFSKDNINTNDFSYQLVHQNSWFNHIEEIGTGQTYDTYIPEYHQGYIENETWLNPNVVLQGNDNINATISYSVNALGTPEYYQSILTGYANDLNSWASSSITKADIDNEVSIVFNNKVYSENGVEIYTSSDDMSDSYPTTPLSGRGDEVFAIGNSGDNVITVTVPGELYGYAQGGAIGTAFLDGKDGQDTLIGNIGVDVFSFSSALDGTVDTIKNFDVANDKIGLNATVFNQILKDNSVDSDPPFIVNKDTGEREMRDGSPYSTIGLELENSDVFGSYILHNQETGAVSYDYTGQGNYDAAIQFAQVDAGLVLTASNFTILDLPAVNYPL